MVFSIKSFDFKVGIFKACSKMDVLKPQIIKIDGRRYRKLPYYAQQGESSNSTKKQTCDTYWEDEVCDDQEAVDVEKTDKGYSVRCADVPSFYFKFICGKKNETKNRIERETRTHISIPRPGMEGDVVISGQDRNSVLSAKTRIELIVDSSRWRMPSTHFISIPLACESTLERFEEFKKIVIEQCAECKGFVERILQIPEKLHLTIGMMVLMSENEIVKAGNYLKDLQDEIKRKFIDNNPMHVILEGVECMNDDPSEVSVLYAKVKLADASDRLQALAEFLVDSFVSNGLMKREYDRVKLHATVINTKFKDKEEEKANASKPGSSSFKTGQGQWNKKSVFDARKVIQLCENFKFGEMTVNSIHLSKRGSYGPDGGYYCEKAIEI